LYEIQKKYCNNDIYLTIYGNKVIKIFAYFIIEFIN